MEDEENFVDDLMNKAFNLKAPDMPDFSKLEQEDSVVELNFEQLDYLSAAGKMELQIAQTTEKTKK